jgi:type I restriction enzyme, S subunit
MGELTKLGSNVEMTTGYPFRSAGYTAGPGGVRLLRGDNIVPGRIRWDGAKFWPRHELPDYAKYQLRTGDLVLAMDRPWIAAGLRYAELRAADVPSFLVQRTARLRARPGLDQRFLAYLIGSPRFSDYILGVQTGTAVPHLSASQIMDFEFELPEFRVQQAVGQILGALDDKIEINDLIASSARALSRAHFFAAAANARDSAAVELGLVACFLGRGITPRYTEHDSQLRVLNQKCIRAGRVNLAQARRTLAARVPATKLLREHDVLVNSTGVGTLGRVARWTGAEPCTADSHVTIVRFDPAKTDPLCAGIAMLGAGAVLETLGEGSTGQTELSRARLAALRLVLPSRRRAARLRPTLQALEDRGDAALAESRALAELRDVLLPRLMSGEIQVRDARCGMLAL